MLIYVFVEHYPNPYKPYLDAQFAQFVQDGHELAIFAAGRYLQTVHETVRRYRLDRLTYYYPATSIQLPRFIARLLWRAIAAPRESLRRIRAVYERERGLKENLLRIVRAILLPTRAPQLCLVHNLATAAGYDFLAHCYPQSRVVMYFHGGEVGGVRRVLRERQIFERMQKVFTNTGFSLKQAVERGCPAARVETIPVGFDLTAYAVDATRVYRACDILRLISVGRLGEEKGHDYALQALQELVSGGYRNLRYTLIGHGRRREALKAFVLDHGLSEYVRFAGELDQQGVIRELARADVLILPSLVTDTWAETQACVVQEAMLMRLLVLTTEAGGVPESIPPAMRRFSVPHGNAAAIAAAVRSILALPDQELARVADAGRRFVMDGYDIRKINHRLLERSMSVGVR